MITHIVLFKLKEEKRQDALVLAEDLAKSLERLPSVRSVRVGVDIRNATHSSDIGLLVDIESDSAYQEYLSDPDHHAGARALLDASDSISTVAITAR